MDNEELSLKVTEKMMLNPNGDWNMIAEEMNQMLENFKEQPDWEEKMKVMKEKYKKEQEEYRQTMQE